MSRTTIDFGIDLGTTNSVIAALEGTDPKIFKNDEGFDFTPSAVFIDKKGRLFVGHRAKERLGGKEDNAFSEFKLQMGTELEYVFDWSGRRMKPEELSAEVLKSLKIDVEKRTGENVTAAVITVPAAFELPQCMATERSARHAGFSNSPLLQEPVAAALAYGFQSESDKVFWMVYDLGGGTFDAAIIQVRGGEIQVVNHGGDNNLGGKLIDWAIVENLLIPALTKEYRLSDFNRGNPKWKSAIAKLKLEAEKAKIWLSNNESAEILIEYLCNDDRGDAVEFEYEFKKTEIEKLMEPIVLRSINICKKILEEKRLGPENIEKFVLVGGPTLTPYLRERLTDKNEGLGIPLEFREDPLTVVAKGAAIFAGSRRIEHVELQDVKAGQYVIQLKYDPVGTDVEPLVGGTVGPDSQEDFTGYTIEFIDRDREPPWRSGKVSLTPDGKFMMSALAQKGRVSTFLIELCDSRGSKLDTTPGSFDYKYGMLIAEPPLTHTVGVALANNEMDVMFRKGDPLPDRRRKIYRTAYEAKRGQSEVVIKIPVVEGENTSRADRNRHIGDLEIDASEISRDVPAGSEVEVTIEISESRIMRAEAYIPFLDQEIEKIIDVKKVLADPDSLKEELEREKSRLETVNEKAQETNDPKALEVLGNIQAENIVHDVESLLNASYADKDARDGCQKRLLDLKEALDKAEDALEWPVLLVQAENELKDAKKIINEYGDAKHRQDLQVLEKETRHAIDVRDPDLLRSKIQEVSGLNSRILHEQPGFWVGMLRLLEERKATMQDASQTDQYFDHAQRAINSNDLEALKSAVRQLIGQLPAEEQQEFAKGFGSTIL